MSTFGRQPNAPASAQVCGPLSAGKTGRGTGTSTIRVALPEIASKLQKSEEDPLPNRDAVRLGWRRAGTRARRQLHWFNGILTFSGRIEGHGVNEEEDNSARRERKVLEGGR